MARDLFSGSVKGLKKLKAEDSADKTLNDLLNRINPNEIVRDGDDGVRLQKGEEKEKDFPETVSTQSGRDTAVSEKSVAKIQQNLDATKNNYGNRSNNPRGFITNISSDLGLEQHESYNYGTFVSKDGVVITVRIPNRNTNISTWDDNGESNGISIVISKFKNKGIKNNGNAHVFEFFYPKKVIGQSDGKPLVSSNNSVLQTLQQPHFTSNITTRANLYLISTSW